jgi:hypothetical protein
VLFRDIITVSIYTSRAAKFSFLFSMALIDQIYSRIDLGKYMGSASLSLFGHNFVIYIVCNDANFEILVQKFNENLAPLVFQGQNKNYPVVQKS